MHPLTQFDGDTDGLDGQDSEARVLAPVLQCALLHFRGIREANLPSLQTHIISIVPPHDRESEFYVAYFFRPILDRRRLNSCCPQIAPHADYQAAVGSGSTGRLVQNH